MECFLTFLPWFAHNHKSRNVSCILYWLSTAKPRILKALYFSINLQMLFAAVLMPTMTMFSVFMSAILDSYICNCETLRNYKTRNQDKKQTLCNVQNHIFGIYPPICREGIGNPLSDRPAEIWCYFCPLQVLFCCNIYVLQMLLLYPASWRIFPFHVANYRYIVGCKPLRPQADWHRTLSHPPTCCPRHGTCRTRRMYAISLQGHAGGTRPSAREKRRQPAHAGKPPALGAVAVR